VLTTTPAVSETLGKRHKTVGMWAQQMVSVVRRWLPNVPIKLLGDTAYSILELGLHCAAHHVTLIAPFRLDSVIHQIPPKRTEHTIGRPRVVGERLPSLEQVLHDPTTKWQRLTLDWYGEGKRQWSDLAIERTTPILFGLYSLVTLFGHALHPNDIPLAQTAWYHKQAATFRDVFAVVRRHLWGNFSFPTSPTDPDVVLLPRSTLSRLASAVCY
jgi:hypothetical protein